MGFIYRFLNGDSNIIYIGKTRNSFSSRLNNHNHLSNKCYDEINKIEYFELESETELDLYETFLINKYKPIHNIAKKYKDCASIEFPIQQWINYEDVDGFIKKHKITKRQKRTLNENKIRKVIQTAYDNAEMIITYGNGFEFRKNRKRKGKYFHDQVVHDMAEGKPVYGEITTSINEELMKEPFIFNHEWDYIAAKLFPEGKGLRSQVPGKTFCFSYCIIFKTCDRDCDNEECHRRTDHLYERR